MASAEELSNALEMQSEKIQKALKELQTISHAGSFQQWLTNYKTFLASLKEKSPMIYASFMERYSAIKTNLKTKGVIK
jgi:trehalose-6-phosphate synthase